MCILQTWPVFSIIAGILGYYGVVTILQPSGRRLSTKNCQQTIPVLCCIPDVPANQVISSLLTATMVMDCSTLIGAGAIVAATVFSLWQTPKVNMVLVAVQTAGPSNILRKPCLA